jgi:uncharacterized protein
MGHPAVGPSFESLVVEAIVGAAADALRPYHYRTALGDEIDLVLVRGGRPMLAVEVKRSTAPVVSAGFHRAVADLGIEGAYVVHPDTGREPYAASAGVTAIGLTSLVRILRSESESGLPGRAPA